MKGLALVFLCCLLASCASSRKTMPPGPTATPVGPPLCAVTPAPTQTPGAAVMSYAADVASMFTSYGCNDCHGGIFPSSRFRPDVYVSGTQYYGGITEQGDEAHQLNVCDVIKGDANNSYLVRKLEGAPGILGSKMPPGASPTVNATQVAWLRLWIDQGAPNN